MPASNTTRYSASRRTDAYCDSAQLEDASAVADQEGTRPSKRKAKHATSKQSPHRDDADESISVEHMGHQEPPSSAKPQSILGQLQQTYPQNSRNKNASDAMNNVSAIQKVSDEHTPPADTWARNSAYGRSPPAERMPGLSAAGPTSYEPGFSSRGAFNTRSPPISPPVRKARPVSYGGSIPPLPGHPRVSTSPYGYAYGSPQALPHLPQQHFYGPHDVDLGLAHHMGQMNVQDPVALKFARIPGPGTEYREAVLLVGVGELNILCQNGEKLELIGSLRGIEGDILDACLLTCNASDDPFLEYRPLVALTIHGVGKEEGAPVPSVERNARVGPDTYMETKVMVFSLNKCCQIAELLRVPSTGPAFPGARGGYEPATTLNIHASGNSCVVASSDSGELFVFGITRANGSAVFECLGKYWTTIQPRQRRDSSHGQSSDADVSPADLGRGTDGEESPILSLNGRWLAFCPAATPSRRSIGAVLGNSVVHNKNSNINAGTAPSRPQATCEVQSPDIDTFFSKVAKGFAQEAVRSAKWISEKGMQTWQTYWKKEPYSEGTTPSSPPVYSPRLAVAQFPPTHAFDDQNLSRDPEVVSILDLKLLHETQGRRNTDIHPVATFQPPGGCSFLSFMPTGLGLLSANRKGDVQYVWDLQQVKYVRLPRASTPPDSGCVRQVARYERLSPSTIVDLVWDGPTGYRFALLTKNRTIHIFDLPKTAFQWPPPPVKTHRPTSAPVDQSQAKPEHEPAPSGGFFASAMSIAGRTQPMLANLRGRAPSVGGGFSGFGASGLGLASTTGIKSGRAVAAGLSKSLGAATETVTSLRHANQSRVHLKIPARVGMPCWQRREGKSILAILDLHSIKHYYVRMTKPREDRQRQMISVFDARKAVSSKLPKATDLSADHSYKSAYAKPDDETESDTLSGFWKYRASRGEALKIPHPLASAEIETNAPYQPFHTDHRVSISLIEDYEPPFSTVMRQEAESTQKWVFGGQVRFHGTSTTAKVVAGYDESDMYRETDIMPDISSLGTTPVEALEDTIGHVVSNTKKRKGKKGKAHTHIDVGGDEDVGRNSVSLARAHDVSQHEATFSPDFDLLESEDQV
ncbi:hypothetical protein EDD37DRAFT_256301 [Exophiala viscosa]|uniref:BCAS3 domain-containing protein n=1 Tax=Exophiala viscosa TaxID=2486360 RepID=A0AAN6II88_9EURO|nr:hypothetical protein EDD36DRAFT_22067 [Exophiala viscosa]KAI1627229.1 hypothetical protein EDD37DRAFT_256301 [Exophiala viscosa]